VLPNDVSLALAWYRDPEVLRFSEGEGTAPYDPTTVEEMYRYLADRGELYVIEIEETRGWHPIGDVALCPDSLPIVIGEATYRSRGLGTRVLRLLIKRARDLGWSTLKVKSIYTDNHRSRRLFERAGFIVTGEATDEGGRSVWRLELQLR